MARFAVIVPAAGRSSRFGPAKDKKVYAELDGRAVWLRAVEPFVNRDDVGQTIVVIAPEDRELFERRFRASVAFMNIKVVEGGAERADSVANALAALQPDCDFVAVHDAARPCLVPELIEAVFAAAVKHGAALPGLAVSETLKRVGADRNTIETVPRAGLYTAQTPQAFRRDWIVEAYEKRAELGREITDDAQLVEALGHHCHVVDGSPWNLKITGRDDLRLAAAVLQAIPKPKREGPIHPFADEQQMWGGPPKPKPKPKDLF